MGVCAEAGAAETIKTRATTQAAILLFILEFNKVPGFELVQPLRVNFKDVSGWMAGSVSRSPGARQDGIHHDLLGVYPDHSQIHKNKKHMDGGIETAVTRLDKHNASFGSEAGTKHQAPQAAQETVAIQSG